MQRTDQTWRLGLNKMSERLAELFLCNFNATCRKNATAVTYKWEETDTDCACGRLAAGCEQLSWPCVDEF